jgi:hypothetical protein
MNKLLGNLRDSKEAVPTIFSLLSEVVDGLAL